ncbi:DUF6789 family protein [uncultured Brevundimonas sp.]|uniref:DUF6789 family protein n=1 Tax=uncultured Brevundimonas sp. TaxID=213418 RepID=UPI0030EC7E14|tara:strand:- start:1187 stop:1657 length:471 start_codon:yes stop_codon:yes gene_type:complete
MMSRVQKGIVAGLAATAVVSAMELVNVVFLKWFDPFPGVIAHLIGMDGNLAVGWAVHVVMGVFILGPLFGILCPKLPTSTAETKGIVFAVGAWVLLMLGIIMLGDPRTFTGAAGFGVVGWMLVTNAVFGVVLGKVYAGLVARDKRAATHIDGATAH